MSSVVTDPCLVLFREHLESVNFQLGEASGYWKLASSLDNWPSVDVWIKCSTSYVESGRLTLRFDLQGYPSKAPTAVPWDTDAQAQLKHSEWPSGRSKVDAVFKHAWNGGQSLYAPCDRLAQQGHQPWATQHKKWWWTPDKEITTYLSFVHQLLEGFDEV